MPPSPAPASSPASPSRWMASPCSWTRSPPASAPRSSRPPPCRGPASRACAPSRSPTATRGGATCSRACRTTSCRRPPSRPASWSPGWRVASSRTADGLARAFTRREHPISLGAWPGPRGGLDSGHPAPESSLAMNRPAVLVIGGGNAALCAALSAREAGASVLLLEASPRAWRGGNSQHTRNLRCMHDAPQDVLTDAYPEEEFWQDLLKVTGGQTDEKLARLAIRESAHCRDWMRRHGVNFQPSLSGTLHLSRTNAFFIVDGLDGVLRPGAAAQIRVRYRCASPSE